MVFGRSFVVQIENLQLVQDYLGAKLIDKRHVHLLAPPSLLFHFHFHADTQSSRRAPTTSISTSSSTIR